MNEVFEILSDPLKKGINMYIRKMNMSEKDRSLFLDILKFTFNEGKIKGKEQYLDEIKNEDLPY